MSAWQSTIGRGLVALAVLGLAVPELAVPAAARPIAANAAVGDGGVPAFYRWNGPVPATPGTLLASEALPPDQALANAGTSLRILYTSRDGISDTGSLPVSGALFIPRGAPPPGGWPLMVWAHGTTGIADVCAPSFSPRSRRDVDYLNAWLAAGFAVAASDYQGLGTPGLHPYSNYRAASYSVLDSARAAAGASFGIARDMVLVGQSQGAGAAVAAAGYAAGYAPDLNLRGVVVTGPPNLSRTAIESGLAWSATDTMVTGAYAMIGFELAQFHADLPREAVFTPAGMELHDLVGSTCLGGLMQRAAERGLSPATTFRPGMLARLWATDVPLRAAPTIALPAPIFFGIGAADTAALPLTTLSLAVDMCEADTRVAVRVYKRQDHGGVVRAATGDAIAFARAALGGTAATSFCAKADGA